MALEMDAVCKLQPRMLNTGCLRLHRKTGVRVSKDCTISITVCGVTFSAIELQRLVKLISTQRQ